MATSTKDIINFENLLYEMRTLLASNDDIRKLLLYPTSDALNREAPSISAVLDDEDLITLYPITEEGLITSNRDCAIELDFTNFTTDYDNNDHSIYGTLVISALCTDKLYKLDNNKLRLFEIMRNIINTTDAVKLSPSGKLEVIGADRFINKHFYGWSIKVLVADDATPKVSF